MDHLLPYRPRKFRSLVTLEDQIIRRCQRDLRQRIKEEENIPELSGENREETARANPEFPPKKNQS